MRAAAAGDRDAAGELIQSHQGPLYGYIFRMSGHADVAEDVVQEAFVRVLTNLDRFDPTYRFSTWLFTIARRVLLSMRAKKSPATGSDMMDSLVGEQRRGGESRLSEQPDPEATDERIWDHDAVQRALMSVPPQQREILVLFHQHEWPIWLIAEYLELPEGTVKSHLHRGRIRLRDALRGVDTLRAAIFDERQQFGLASADEPPTAGRAEPESSAGPQPNEPTPVHVSVRSNIARPGDRAEAEGAGGGADGGANGGGFGAKGSDRGGTKAHQREARQ